MEPMEGEGGSKACPIFGFPVSEKEGREEAAGTTRPLPCRVGRVGRSGALPSPLACIGEVALHMRRESPIHPGGALPRMHSVAPARKPTSIPWIAGAGSHRIHFITPRDFWVLPQAGPGACRSPSAATTQPCLPGDCHATGPKQALGQGCIRKEGTSEAAQGRSTGGWRRLPKRLGAVTVGYKCH